MSKEQIEEMAEIIAQNAHKRCLDVPFSDIRMIESEFCIANVPCCEYCIAARSLINAGYRKQSEGEWYLEHETYGRTLCSNCGEEALKEYSWDDALKGHLKKGHLKYVWSNFCPNCGAKMRKEDECK